MDEEVKKKIDASLGIQIPQLRERLKNQKRIRNPVFANSTVIEKKGGNDNASE